MMYALAFAMVYVLGAVAPGLTITSPKVDATCVGSPLHLGTDNIPMNNEPETSVINMWAFIGPAGPDAVAWHYETRLGKHFIQTSVRERAVSKRALSPAQYKLYTAVLPHADRASESVLVSSAALTSLAKSYARVGVHQNACFTSRLPESYFPHLRR